ncbi:MAG: hypothetical protein ACOCWR_09270 [Oceanidesulfovibrio sp.]
MSTDTALSFAIRPLLLLKSFGAMAPILVGLTLVPMAVSYIYAEYAIAMRYGFVILLLLGLTLVARRIRVSLGSMQTNVFFGLLRTFLTRVNMPSHAVRRPRLLGMEMDEDVIRCCSPSCTSSPSLSRG